MYFIVILSYDLRVTRRERERLGLLAERLRKSAQDLHGTNMLRKNRMSRQGAN